MDTASFFGGPLDLGPCNAYWDTATGGANISLGGLNNLVFRFGGEVTDLVTAQTGTRRADAVFTSGFCEVEFGLAEASLERMAELIPGFEINENSANEIIGFSFGPAIGLRHSSMLKQMTLIRVFDEVESTDPLDELVIFKIAVTPNIEVTYDSATQRFVGLMGEAYRDRTQLSPTGRPLMFGGGIFN